MGNNCGKRPLEVFVKKNVLRETIEYVLKDVHIETGRKDQWDKVVSELEEAISAKITRHEIDFYTESKKE